MWSFIGGIVATLVVVPSVLLGLLLWNIRKNGLPFAK